MKVWWGEAMVDVDVDGEPLSRRYGGVLAKSSLKYRRSPRAERDGEVVLLVTPKVRADPQTQWRIQP
jgi:hypothetical protein